MKRTPMKRTPIKTGPYSPESAPKRRTGLKRSTPIGQKLNPRKCKGVCGGKFKPTKPIQPTCDSFACKLAYGLKVAAKKQAERKAAERARDRVKREKLKTRSDFLKEAQAAFNAFIRERDKDKPCICCGRFTSDADLLTGSRWDCGHYRSTGSAPQLRFDERNAHRQRAICNRHGAGRAVDYRIGLIRRIGLEAVEALEADQTTRKWSAGDLKAIRDHYRAKLKALKARGLPV